MSEDTDQQLLEFPCEFPIKAMGHADADFAEQVWSIVTRHAPETPTERLRTTPSRKGRFVSVTVTIEAQSRAQLDAIYQELNDHERVLMTL
ncbi:DUF493 domain-containing protein [Ectothiorhodospiraceae bacterium WFHF3C12]|nr:DUF493 domain-containing protein [Ectothiorhodospiraceae bacterium WFHF3C12]